MIKKILLTISLILILSSNSFAAGSSGGSSGSSGAGEGSESNELSKYKQAVKKINYAKKLEKKGKTEKANKVIITLPKAFAPFSTATLENLAATQTAITTPKNNVAFAPLEACKLIHISPSIIYSYVCI